MKAIRETLTPQQKGTDSPQTKGGVAGPPPLEAPRTAVHRSTTLTPPNPAPANRNTHGPTAAHSTSPGQRDRATPEQTPQHHTRRQRIGNRSHPTNTLAIHNPTTPQTTSPLPRPSPKKRTRNRQVFSDQESTHSASANWQPPPPVWTPSRRGVRQTHGRNTKGRTRRGRRRRLRALPGRSVQGGVLRISRLPAL